MWSWIKAHKIALIVTVVIVGLLYVLFGRPKPVTYDEFTVTRKNISDTLELSGKVQAGQSATLRFATGGLVTYLGPKEGDTVKKWQTLASIDTRQLQKILEEKLNLYAMQRATFDQAVDDTGKTVPSGDLQNTLQRLLAKNQYQLDNTVKDVEYQNLSLQLSRLTSPLAGILIQSPITTSNVQVLPSDTWMVVDPNSLYFSADLDETDLKRVSVGQKVTIVLDAYPDATIVTTITSIGFTPTETSTGTTYEVKMALTPQDGTTLRLGLNGTASVILTEKDNVLTLPAGAVNSSSGTPSVLIKSGKTYKEQKIETGIENGGMVEIVGGLGDQDHVYAKK